MQFEDFFHRVARATEINTQRQLADILGVGAAAITLAKKRGVPASWSLKIASVFGINPNWIQTGQGPVYQAGREGTFFVPRVSARACAGGGSLDVRDNIVDEVPFATDWLRKKGHPENMVLMEIMGDSMSPELEEGDHILVDLGQKRITGRVPLVLGLEEGMQVKRVESAPGVVILLSTNPRYPSITLRGDEVDSLRIIGRVLWSSREYS